MTKLSDAIAIRDRAMAILAQHGERSRLGSVPNIVAMVGGVHLTLMNGDELRGIDPCLLYSNPDDAAGDKLDDHALFIHSPRTVFQIRWDDDGSPVKLVAFKRGPWEEVVAAQFAEAT